MGHVAEYKVKTDKPIYFTMKMAKDRYKELKEFRKTLEKNDKKDVKHLVDKTIELYEKILSVK